MNHYTVLGIHPGAPQAEIKAAFRRLAMRHHPDRGGDAEKFAGISKAYEALTAGLCPECEGTGEVRVRNGAFTKQVPCPRCWA